MRLVFGSQILVIFGLNDGVLTSIGIFRFFATIFLFPFLSFLTTYIVMVLYFLALRLCSFGLAIGFNVKCSLANTVNLTLSLKHFSINASNVFWLVNGFAIFNFSTLFCVRLKVKA